MFARPGLCGMGIGRLGLVAASQPSLVAQALAILAKYGSAANLYLPGVGAINGITAGNWLDTVGGTAATVDNPVGLVVNALGGQNLVQATTENKLILRRGLVNQLTQSDFVNGVTDATASAGLVTASTLAGYGGALAIGHGGVEYTIAYKSFATTVGAYYTFAAIVKMDDGAAPTFGTDVTSATSSFALILHGDPIGPPSTYTATLLPDGNYMVCASKVAIRAAANTGIVKYNSNNNRTLKVTRYGLFTGTVTASQIIDAGGIPVTTTAPASSTNGPFAWQFDGSNDSFTSTLTPGNAGFFCASANVTDSVVLRTLLGAGAGSDASSGVWLSRNASNALTLQVGNGTTRNSVSAAYPVATNAVASAGWDASNMFVGINGTETSGAKSVNCTSANTINLGVLTGTTNPMLGTISGGAIIMPTVLPTASERATLRQFIASLSGVTL